MPNRLFYTLKLNSSLLQEFKYDLNISFSQAVKSNLIISLADSQMLKTIRELTHHEVDFNKIENWYEEKEAIQKRKSSKENKKKIKDYQNKIYDMMYIPEYIPVVMESKKHYEKMFKKGFKVNGRRYVRFSCSASQARVSTVIFIAEDIKEEAKKRLDNGRDLKHPLAPSKYSAYFGLYSSAIKEVTTPRFCVIPDYCTMMNVDVDYVVEQGEDDDDIIEQRNIEVEKNWFDGSGLISPDFAEQWGKDLELEYTPCQFCIRYSFVKGMVNRFDFVKFCKEKNNENYFIKDIYGKMVDLREIDVILTEGQFKLWDSWESQEDYEKCCAENHLVFGVTRPAPEKDKEATTLNYQFLQTLDLSDEDIIELCEDTVKYIQGVSYDDVYYTILFLLGENLNYTSINNYLKSSDNYWLKSLICNHSLLNDKYSKEKVREYIIRRIEQACLGKIIVNGNFQAIVPDGYAFMQWATGQEVTGLLRERQFYSQFWLNKGVKEIDCMRSPMTHFSEHYKVDVVTNEEMDEWFKYSYSGIIVNCWDNHTMNFAGSDYDFDILATTNSQAMIRSIFPNQRVVTYDTPKPVKKLFTEEDLFKCDCATFGSLIGQITNQATAMCSLMANFPKDSKEYNLLQDRVKMCCASQSRQIDKAKIGREVKGIPSIWRIFQVTKDEDDEETKKKKKFYNSILTDKKPYFFRYKYDSLNKQYRSYVKAKEEDCLLKYNRKLSEVLKNPHNEQERIFKDKYYKFMDIIDSDCVMNKICKYIESIDFNIKQKMRSSSEFDYKILLSREAEFDEKIYEIVSSLVTSRIKEWAVKREEINSKQQNYSRTGIKFNEEEVNQKDQVLMLLREDLLQVCSNEEELTNYLLKLFYEDKISLNKNILWKICGRQIFENVKKKNPIIYIPEKDKEGILEFLYEKYDIKRVDTTQFEREEAERKAQELVIK